MPEVTLVGADGQSGSTVTYTTTEAANFVSEIQNSIFQQIQDSLVTASNFQGVQGAGGGATPSFPVGPNVPSLNYVLLDGNQFTVFDQPNTPYIDITNTQRTVVSNSQSVQTVVSGSSGGLTYTAVNAGDGTTPGADVWVNGGINYFSVEDTATAQFNIDGGFNYIGAQQGSSTVRLYTGYAHMAGSDSGLGVVSVGGSDASVAALDFVSGSNGALLTSLGKASINLATGSATVPLGSVTINATGDANWLNANGSSPTVNLDSGQLLLTSAKPSDVVINPTGDVTIWGGLPVGPNSLNEDGFAPNSGSGLLTVNPGAGSVTLFGGNSGGVIHGGTNGQNVLMAGTYSVAAQGGVVETSTLYGGGNDDYLQAGKTGDNWLIASYGNTSLVGNQSANGNNFMLSQVALGDDPSVVGADSVWGNDGNDKFVLGSGNAFIDNEKGSDLFIDNGDHATAVDALVEIADFKLGVDFLDLSGADKPSVSSVNVAGQNTFMHLSDGLTIKFDNVQDTDANKFLKP